MGKTRGRRGGGKEGEREGENNSVLQKEIKRHRRKSLDMKPECSWLRGNSDVESFADRRKNRRGRLWFTELSAAVDTYWGEL